MRKNVEMEMIRISGKKITKSEIIRKMILINMSVCQAYSKLNVKKS
jgi:hypothetical protein